ncbi:MAG: alpha/beta hydrolase, partial [Ilumatobacteraceae bacterium]
MVRISRTLISAIVVPLLVVACGGGNGGNSDTGAPDTTTAEGGNRVDNVRAWTSDIAWTECGVGFECGTFEVPYDYSDPDIGTFVLPLQRRLADDPERRIGSLLINPGGPGGSALEWAEYADSIFSA